MSSSPGSGSGRGGAAGGCGLGAGRGGAALGAGLDAALGAAARGAGFFAAGFFGAGFFAGGFLAGGAFFAFAGLALLFGFFLAVAMAAPCRVKGRARIS